MELPISMILSLLFISANVQADHNENCQVSGKYNGKCVFLKECKYYANMIADLQSQGRINAEFYEKLREANCGYINTDALICCPNNLNSENQTANSSPNNADNSKPPTAQSPTGSIINPTQAPLSPATSTKECGRVLTFKYFRGNRTEFDDFPWTTLVEYETPTGKNFGCGGALIHSRYVLTAAHCVADLPPSWTVKRVRFGEYDTNTDVDCVPDGFDFTICNEQPVDVNVEQVIVHPGFKSSDASRLHDIALLKLSTSVKFTSNVRPICLPTKKPFLQRYYTSGWGKDVTKGSIRTGTNLKYMSYVSLVSNITCQSSYAVGGVKISQSHMCGGSRLNQKPCIGDAGGPLMGLEEIPNLEKRIVAFGVLSLNKPATGDCQSGQTSVYTKVLDYMDWIVNNLRK